MSTKTLRKRIAVVAVSALTAGVLSVASAPVANAGVNDAITKADIFVVDPASAGTAAAIGQCAIAASARLTDAQTVGTTNSTGTVLAVGAVIEFDTATNGAANLVITGPAVWDGIKGSTTTATISQDAKSIGFQDITRTQNLKVTGTGDIVVTAYNSLTIGEGTAVKTFSITGVTTCAAGDSPVVANSFFSLRNDPNEEGSAADDVMAAADLTYGETQYIAIELKNGYKADLSGTAGLLTAEATGSALVGIDATGTTNIGFKAELAADATNVDVFVNQNTVAAPGAPLTTTVTIKYNGTTLATKTLTFHGVGTSIVVDEVTVGTSGATGAFRYLVKDAAGNNVDANVGTTPAGTTITAAAAGFVSAGIVTAAQGTNNSSGSTKGTGTFNCVAAASAPVTSGTQSVTIGAQIGTTLVKSNAFTARCGDSNIRVFGASMDKVTYSPGEIATLTLTATDRHAAMVGDTAVVGADFNQISIPGMTIIGSAISSADVFTSGAKTYKFRVDQSEGSFVGQAQVTVNASAAATEKVAKTLQYTIKASGSTVTNAEVLKSIVALIASINKQIQALQALILKKK
jgi:hypothetical protein